MAIDVIQNPAKPVQRFLGLQDPLLLLAAEMGAELINQFIDEGGILQINKFGSMDIMLEDLGHDALNCTEFLKFIRLGRIAVKVHLLDINDDFLEQFQLDLQGNHRRILGMQFMHLIGINQNQISGAELIGDIVDVDIDLSLYGYNKLQGLMPMPADTADAVQEELNGKLLGKGNDLMAEFQA